MATDPSSSQPLLDPLRPVSHQVRRGSVLLFLGIVGLAVGLLVVMLALDVSMGSLKASTLRAALGAGDTLVNALGSLGEVLAAVLGLSLTVVAIVVQLASQRYSAKIVDLFMRDRVNLAAFGFMAASCIYVVVLPVVVPAGAVPVLAVWVGLVLTVVNFGILLPYFGHIFRFLNPNNIITQMEADAVASLQRALERGHVAQAQSQMALAIERIADNCIAAITQSDRSLALHSVRTLEHLICRYFEVKDRLPHDWRLIHRGHFYALADEFYEEIVTQGAWVEAKALMECEHVLRRALGTMDELVSQLAATTRAIGVAALRAEDREAVALVIRFFNTYIRHALNDRNVRAVYNVLYQYRLLSIASMRDQHDICPRVVEHLVYYGQIANAMGLPFVTVTAAHDVRVLCERAFLTESFDVLPMLEQFLNLDEHSEGKSEELALLGVRKAQSILGAFFLEHNAHGLVRLIQEDMRDEAPDRLVRIRDAILGVRDRKFWEVTDRGFNFDYVEPECRPFIEEFFRDLMVKIEEGPVALSRRERRQAISEDLRRAPRPLPIQAHDHGTLELPQGPGFEMDVETEGGWVLPDPEATSP